MPTSTHGMAKMANNMTKHTSRRKSATDMSQQPGSDAPQPEPSKVDQSVRRKAYYFDDIPPQPFQPGTGVLPASIKHSPPMSSAHTTPTTAVQGRALSVNAAQPTGSAHTGVSGVTQESNITAPVLCGDNRSLPNITVSTSQQDRSMGQLYPDFLRKRVAPSRHKAVPIEVDHGLRTKHEKDGAASILHPENWALCSSWRMKNMMKRGNAE